VPPQWGVTRDPRARPSACARGRPQASAAPPRGTRRRWAESGGVVPGRRCEGRSRGGSCRATPRERCGDGVRSGRPRGMGRGEPRRASVLPMESGAGGTAAWVVASHAARAFCRWRAEPAAPREGSWRATPRERSADGERSGRRGARQRGYGLDGNVAAAHRRPPPRRPSRWGRAGAEGVWRNGWIRILRETSNLMDSFFV